jgi:hypothetical protein
MWVITSYNLKVNYRYNYKNMIYRYENTIGRKTTASFIDPRFQLCYHRCDADECKIFNVVVVCHVVTDDGAVTFVGRFTDVGVGEVSLLFAARI